MPKRETKDVIISRRTLETKNENGKTTQQQTNQKIKVAQEPDYIKLYLSTLLTFKDLPKQMSTLLLEVLKLMSYADPTCKHGGQLISLNAYNKKLLTTKLDIKMNTLDQNLTKFVKAGILKRVGYGTFQANPNMFGRGEWLDIKAIRATFDFNAQTVAAEIDGNEQVFQ
jgi:hypothetical protein